VNAALPDDGIRSDNPIKLFWFNYMNQTLNALQDAVDKEMQNNKTSNVCNKHFMELINDARNGEHWANKSKSYLT